MRLRVVLALAILFAPQQAHALDLFRKKPQQQPSEITAPAKEEKSASQEKKESVRKQPPFKEYKGPATGELKTHVTAYEDTMVQIARAYDVGFVELRAANPDVDPWMPGKGVNLIIPSMYLLPDGPRRGIVINLPEMRLYYYGKQEMPPESFPLGVGREGLSTPVGSTSVVSKIENPVWRPTKRMREEDPTLPEMVPAGPDNPLGTHAMYLGWPEYRIHGTNKPYGIGRRSSSGCIRMYPEDIVRLYPQVPVGTPVTVVNQPVKAAWIDNEFYVEAHPSIEQANAVEENGGIPAYEFTENDMKEILQAAGKDAERLDWDKIRDVIRTRNGYPVVVAVRPAAS